jgi:type II secretory ATPase GspE/PulE/Tfp pilus assembly ATPase PilB-like protein
MAQRLIRTLCKECKKKVPISKEKQPYIDELFASIVGYEEMAEFPTIPNEVYEAVGCDLCNKTGYKGRIGVYEAILADKNIENIVRENPSEREIKTAALPQKILNMKQDGLIKILKGVTSFDELERVVDMAEELIAIKPEINSNIQPEITSNTDIPLDTTDTFSSETFDTKSV